MIIRGTTPYHNFILPMSVEQIDVVYVTYTQNGEIILDKNSESDTFDIENIADEIENGSVEPPAEEPGETPTESQLSIHLTQEDTLAFKFYPAARKNIAIIQIRILDKDGEAYVSEPIRERIFGTRRDGVIGAVQEEEENVNAG